jgi:hypothetical protein
MRMKGMRERDHRRCNVDTNNARGTFRRLCG